MTQAQLAEVGRLFAKPFIHHNITREEYRDLRQDPAFQALLQGFGDYLQRIPARRSAPQREADPRHLIAKLLPANYAAANTHLDPGYTKRGSEEDCLAAIAQAFSGLGISRVVLKDSVVPVAAWPTGLIVSPVDLLRQQGIDPEKAIKDADYCRLVKLLCGALSGVQIGYHLTNSMISGGARLEEETLKAWLSLPTTQEKGAPLIVHRMAVNYAIWFNVDGRLYSFAPMHVPGVLANLPDTNEVRRVFPGDLIVAASLLIGQPDLVGQISRGTCPGSYIPGTELPSGREWPSCPCLNRVSGEVCLYDNFADEVDGHIGSFGCAWK